MPCSNIQKVPNFAEHLRAPVLSPVNIKVSQRKRKRQNCKRNADSQHTCYPTAKKKDTIHHSNHSHTDIDQPTITKLPPTLSPNNRTETKLAIEKMTFCPPNTYLGSNKMDEAINCIRQSCTHNIFIANSDAATYLYAFNYSWSRISSKFGPSSIISKPPGLYLLPFFSGHHNSGHWLLIALQYKHSTWTGWIINSLPT